MPYYPQEIVAGLVRRSTVPTEIADYTREAVTSLSTTPPPPAPATPGVPLVGTHYPLSEGLHLPTVIILGGEEQAGGTPVEEPPPLPEDSFYAERMLAESPRIYARMDTLAGASLLDSSGNGITGQIIGAPDMGLPGLINGTEPGKCILFDSAGEYVTYGRVPSLELQRLTVIALIKVAAPPGNIPLVRYDSIDSNFWGRGYTLAIDGGQIYFDCGFNLSQYAAAMSPAPLAANTIYHVAGTFDGATVRLYINGVEVAATPAPASSINYDRATGLYLMFNPQGTGADFPNVQPVFMQEFSITSGVLSPDVIANLAGEAL